MESETLEDKKQEDISNVEDKSEEVKEEEKAGEKEEEGDGDEEKKADEKGGDTEMAEKEEEEEEATQEKEEPEEKVEESKEESKEGSKKPKRGRKGSAKKSAKGEKKAKSEPGSKESVTPSERPTRERKTVERYSEPSTGRSASKGLSIEKGRGTQFKDIPNVAFKLSKRKPDDNLQILHTILFGKKTKSHSLKRNIGQFSGYVWAENEEKQRAKVKEKIDKCVKEKLLDFCDVLNIQINKASVKKEELSAKLLEFLESPYPTTDTLLADTEQKGKKRKGKATASSGVASGEAPVKKRMKTPQVGEKRKRSSKTEGDEVDDKIEPSDTKSESQDDDDIDTVPREGSDQEGSKSEGEEELDELKEQVPTGKKSSKKNVKDSGSKAGEKSKSVKKDAPAKSVKSPSKSAKKSSSSTSKKRASNADGASGSASKPKASATKKQKVKKESETDQSAAAKEKITSKKQPSKSSSNVLAKDRGKGKASKKTKPEPSKEQMHAVVVDILKEVDFNTATLSDILRQLGTHFDLDLMHRKAEVKAIITDVINNMSDEEDEGEEADSGDDPEKDEDGDNNAEKDEDDNDAEKDDGDNDA